MIDLQEQLLTQRNAAGPWLQGAGANNDAGASSGLISGQNFSAEARGEKTVRLDFGRI